jgi:hypothetical protein
LQTIPWQALADVSTIHPRPSTAIERCRIPRACEKMPRFP